MHTIRLGSQCGDHDCISDLLALNADKQLSVTPVCRDVEERG